MLRGGQLEGGRGFETLRNFSTPSTWSSSSCKHIASYLSTTNICHVYIRVYTILELARRWRRPVTRGMRLEEELRGESRIVIGQGVPRASHAPVWPPVVCSFCAAIPYLEVQCLLSLIHTPWPTRPPPLTLRAALRKPDLRLLSLSSFPMYYTEYKWGKFVGSYLFIIRVASN